MLLDMLDFLLFHESTEVKKSCFTDEWICQQEVWRLQKRGGFCGAFGLFGDGAELFFSFVSLGDRQSVEETCVVGSRNERWSLKSWGERFAFPYAPVITISLASKRVR